MNDPDTDRLLEELAGRSGLAVAGLGELGLGEGPHPAAFFVVAQLAEVAVDRLLADHFGDDFLDVVPDAFERDGEGRRRWTREGLEPIAIIGGAETFDPGPTLDDALPGAAVLLLDRRASPATVLGWDRVPVRRLVPVAPSLASLTITRE